ncbi:electron transfer flavoprotein subunit alpha/FixB family protein [Legionella sp. W05-934-2]|jgi:electron transfer flavoprotein alpha subunit|uniref:electron transfer flavoprotein subunit alpha/FixB family protein n=1 Tax=Legionella sp. W05-934-2 TaxID=1198649 RepID=UPI003462ED85
MSTLVLIEHDNNKPASSNLSVIRAATLLASPVTALVCGYQCQSVAEEVAKISGVQSVTLIEDECLAHALAENITEAVLAVASGFNHIAAPATTFGKNCLPRIAAKLDVAQISDVTEIVAPDTFKRPIYAGNAIETVQSLDTTKVITIRPSAFSPVEEAQPSAPINHHKVVISAAKTQFINHQLSVSERPELTGADIVVSGGRGLQNKENFQLVEQFADAIGAAVGASRAAVDAGFISNDYQVGQTGKIIAPKLYFAIGISGAVQHLAGIKDAKVIVAINKDAEAPIFQVADYGLVGDLFKIVPELIEKLSN